MQAVNYNNAEENMQNMKNSLLNPDKRKAKDKVRLGC